MEMSQTVKSTLVGVIALVLGGGGTYALMGIETLEGLVARGLSLRCSSAGQSIRSAALGTRILHDAEGNWIYVGCASDDSSNDLLDAIEKSLKEGAE